MMFKLLLLLLWPFRQLARVYVWVYERWPAPKPVSRTPEQKSLVARESQGLVLYQMQSCPYCVKVRKHLRKLDLELELRDIKTDRAAYSELMQGGGLDQVPCLKITEPGSAGPQWLYESSDINAYLDRKFG